MLRTNSFRGHYIGASVTFAFFTIVFSSSQSSAEIKELTVGDFISLAMSSNPKLTQLREQVTIMISSAGEAYGWANTELLDRKQSPLYCPPKKLAVTKEQYVEILSKLVDGHPKVKTEEFRSWPVLLLKALQDTFPC